MKTNLDVKNTEIFERKESSNHVTLKYLVTENADLRGLQALLFLEVVPFICYTSVISTDPQRLKNYYISRVGSCDNCFL